MSLKPLIAGQFVNVPDSSGGATVEYVELSCSDLTSDLTTGTGVAYWVAKFNGTLTKVQTTLKDAPTGAAQVTGFNKNGSTILSTDCTIDAGETNSDDATTPPVISDTAVVIGDIFTVDIDQIGATNTGKGLMASMFITKS